uniref:Uncharacterized protein n=1 Tax=Daphnia galeata TaxID=27404 RepID=A0A8J2WCL2_9CRUS|nr:unnamed protein product [Daphnia galeata]
MRLTDAQHHIKSVANHLLDWADSENINLENHNNKNFIVKAYYSAYMLFNVCSVFGNLNEEISSKAKHAKCMAAASLQNLLNQDVRSSSGDTLNRDKEVIDMENISLEYHKAEGTDDETKPDVVVQLVERFVKSLLTSSPKEEKKDRDKAGTEEIVKTVRRCLNLLTPSNFEKILARIQALDINSEDQLAGVIKLFFDKAINYDPLRFFYAKKLHETKEPEVPDAPTPQPLCEPRENSVTSRASSSSALPIVGNSNTDNLTGAEEVLPSATVTPTTATPPDIVATGLLLLQDKPSLNVATPLPVTATDDGESRAQEGKKVTEEDDSDFLLELQNNPASQTKPEGLPSLEVVLDKASTMKRDVSVEDSTPPIVQMLPAKVFPEERFIVNAKRNSQERIAVDFPAVDFPAVIEPSYLSIYAKMCQALSTKEVTSASDPAETTNFRKVLLTLCQKEFEKDSTGLVDVENKKKEIESAETEVKKQELEFELEVLVYSNRKKSLKTMRFIGELFKLRILSAKIMHQCVLRCLGQPDDEDSLERLCTLLSAIGKELETPMQAPAGRSISISTNRETMDSYFSTLDAIVKQRKISNRIRFMIEDVVNLRKRRWKPRREDNNPKTIDQIHREVHKEREEQKRELNNPQSQRPMGSMGGLSRDGRMGDRRGGDDRNRKQSRPRDDGWNSIQNSGSRGSIGMTSWVRGASGGMSQSLIGGVGAGASQDTRPNRYQIVEDDSGTQHESGKAPSAGRSGLGDVNRGLDSRRSHNSGTFSSRSQQSVTPLIRVTTQPPTLTREVSKDVLLGKSTVTDDEIERKSHSLLGEYFMNEKMEDAVLDMKEWLHPSTVARFINQCLLHVLEHNKKERRATGTLLKEMVKRKLFSSSDILEGFTGLLQSAEDFIVDIPKLWEYVAELVEPLFEEGVINVNFLPQLSSILNSSMVANFVAAVLKELVKAQGVAGAERILIMSNTPLTSVLPSVVDPNAFLAQHKELDFLSKIDSIPRTSGGVGKSSSSATPASQVDIDFQHSLEKFLRDANHLTADDVCSWIQKQYVGDVNPAFIRALVTAVIESSIEGRGTDSKLNNTVLKHWTEVLRRFVDNIADRELQLLYAVQALVTQRQHPKGLIQGIFETLYDSNVVSEEGFESWVSIDDPLEREGKAMALKMITSFLTWLKEADPESDQEADD